MKQRHFVLFVALVFGLLLFAAPLRASAAGPMLLQTQLEPEIEQGETELELGILVYPNPEDLNLWIKAPYTDLVSPSGARIPTSMRLEMQSETVELQQTGDDVAHNAMSLVFAKDDVNEFPITAVFGVSAEAWAAAEPGTYTAEVTYRLITYENDTPKTFKEFKQTVTAVVVKIPIDEAHFPDPNFRRVIRTEAYDRNQDGYLTGDEIRFISRMELANQEIRNLEGLQYFTEADQLNVSGNLLEKLDLSSNPKISVVHCRDNRLTELDLSQNTGLTTLDCSNNRLTELDLSANTSLWILGCSGNRLTRLEIFSTELMGVECQGNHLYLLSLPHADGLYFLSCYDNPELRFVDIMYLPKIKTAMYAGTAEHVQEEGYSYMAYTYSGDYNAWFNVDDQTEVIDRPLQGWKKFGRYWYYFERAEMLMDTLQWIDGKLYYFDSYGIMASGCWKKVDWAWYYFNTSGAAATGWKQIDGKWYYFDVDDGYMVTGMRIINGQVYCFNPGGDMATGWKKINGAWYYFDPVSGAMAYEWKKIEGKWYYFDEDGLMVTGWQTIGGKTYYFTANGDMVTGWRNIDGKRYYFYENSGMAVGWKTIGGSTYFFKSDGAMAAGEYWQGYWLNADGTWTYPYKAGWVKDSGGWKYKDTGGWYAKNASYLIDGVRYTFDAQGYWIP